MASPPRITSKTTHRAKRTWRSGKAGVPDGPAGSPAPSRGGAAPSPGGALLPARDAPRTPPVTRGAVPGASAVPEVPVVASAPAEVGVGTDSAVIVARVRMRRSMRLRSAGERPSARSRRISAFNRRSRRARSRTATDASACSSRRRFARTFRPSSMRSRSLSSGGRNRSNLVRNALPGEGPARAVPEPTASPALSPRGLVESPKELGCGRSLRVSSVVWTTSPTGSSEVVSVGLCAPAQGTTNANGIKKGKRETSHFIPATPSRPDKHVPTFAGGKRGHLAGCCSAI
jgi:hypothetical protein